MYDFSFPEPTSNESKFKIRVCDGKKTILLFYGRWGREYRAIQIAEKYVAALSSGVIKITGGGVKYVEVK